MCVCVRVCVCVCVCVCERERERERKRERETRTRHKELDSLFPLNVLALSIFPFIVFMKRLLRYITHNAFPTHSRTRLTTRQPLQTLIVIAVIISSA